jgi:hypothetical protein
VKYRQDIEAVLTLHVAITQGRMSADIFEMKRSISVIIDRLDVPSSDAERNALKLFEARDSGAESPLVCHSFTLSLAADVTCNLGG